ncbi:ATP-binding cassette domain-containing protein [Pelagerythrobacter marensis]|uniref:ATP-binding cassette domain-containing protein n=1 Tax=Pelagerythrobacter marensis TaxID=543877 RepID=A0ABZ2D4L8_9SPHN
MSFDLALTYRAGKREREVAIATSARILAVTGASGAGKTSLLDCLAGLRRPLAGRVAVGGRVLFDAGAAIDLPPEARRAGYVFQDMRLFPHLTVQDNLTYGATADREALCPSADWPAPDEVAALLDLGSLLDRRPATLSGGEARRVAMARAILSRPAFLLLDEPLASLDPDRAERIMAMLERIVTRITVPAVLVSHEKREVERLAGAILSLD